MTKKNYLKNRMAKNAVYAMLLLAPLFMATSCEKEDPMVIDTDIYIPPANLSQGEIRALLENAEKALYSAEKYTIKINGNGTTATGKKYSHENYRINDVRKKESLNAIVVTYKGKTEYQVFNYRIDSENQYTSGLQINSTVLSDEWFDNFFNGNYTERKRLIRPISNCDRYYGDGDILPSEYGNCKVWENGKITFTTPTETNYEVILNLDKQYKRVNISTKTSNSEYVFTFNVADFTFPNGFNKSDFIDERSQYFNVKVVWGYGKGENTFYVGLDNNNKKALNLNYIRVYAPSVVGKEFAGVSIVGGETYTYNIDGTWTPDFYNQSPVIITDDNTVVNVLWK